MKSIWLAAALAAAAATSGATGALAVTVDMEVTSLSASGLRGDPGDATFAPVPAIAPVPALEAFTLNIVAAEGFLFEVRGQPRLPSSIAFSMIWRFDEALGGPTPNRIAGNVEPEDLTISVLDATGPSRVFFQEVRVDNAARPGTSDLEVVAVTARARVEFLDEVTTFTGLTIGGRFSTGPGTIDVFPILASLAPSQVLLDGVATSSAIGAPAAALVLDPNWTPTPVPVPAGAALLATALAGLTMTRRRRGT